MYARLKEAEVVNVDNQPKVTVSVNLDYFPRSIRKELTKYCFGYLKEH